MRQVGILAAGAVTGGDPGAWFDYDFTDSAHLAALEQVNFSDCTASTGSYLTVSNAKAGTNDVAKLLVAAPVVAWQLTAKCEVDVGYYPKTGVGVLRTSNGYFIDNAAARIGSASTPTQEGSYFTPNYAGGIYDTTSGAVQPNWVRIVWDLTNYKLYTSPDGSTWTFRVSEAPATHLGGVGDKIGLSFNSGGPVGTRTHKVYRLILEAA